MLDRANAFMLASLLACFALVEVVLAQKASPPGSTPALSIDRVVNWLQARPGVWIAVAIMLVVAIYMFVNRRRPRA